MINVDELIQNARKSGDKTALTVYQSVKCRFQEADKAKNAKPLDYAAQIQIINKACKGYEVSISQFSEAGRDDLVAQYTAELEVLKKLLPEPVSDGELDHKLMEWCAEKGFRKENGKVVAPYEQQLYSTTIPKKEMGNAIKFLKGAFPQADGAKISSIVKIYVG